MTGIALNWLIEHIVSIHADESSVTVYTVYHDSERDTSHKM